jgi:hypothetical protein
MSLFEDHIISKTEELEKRIESLESNFLDAMNYITTLQKCLLSDDLYFKIGIVSRLELKNQTILRGIV